MHGIQLKQTVRSTVNQKKPEAEMHGFLNLIKRAFVKSKTFHTTSEKQYLKIREEALKKKSYAWINLNLNQYISKFEKNILMEMQVIDQLYSISFIKTSLDKKLYEILVEKN